MTPRPENWRADPTWRLIWTAPGTVDPPERPSRAAELSDVQWATEYDDGGRPALIWQRQHPIPGPEQFARISARRSPDRDAGAVRPPDRV